MCPGRDYMISLTQGGRLTCTHVTIILVLNSSDYLSTVGTGNARAEAVRVAITTSST